jgi:N-acetylglucosaminyl-diphospho-decaprenol L-rhamnosyltransferase
MAPGQIHARDEESLLTPAPVRSRARPRLLPVKSPELSVIIVNFCQWRNTWRLVRQLDHSELARSNRSEIIVVDNHSPSHPAMARLRHSDRVSLRRFSRNRGFARAVNEGFRLSHGDWVLVLNPDLSVGRGFLDQVRKTIQFLEIQEPEVGIVGFRLKHPDGSPQASCGKFPTLSRTLMGLALPRARRKCQLETEATRKEVPWLTGCCLLIRRECLQDVSGFDESYFLYYEDVDLCLRAREEGWKVIYEPSLDLTHHTPLHMRSVPAPLRLMTRHALLTYAARYWPRWQRWLLGKIVWGEALAREVRSSLAGAVEEARFHHELRKLVENLNDGDLKSVRRRIRLAAAYLENGASAQDGKTC